MLRGHRSFVDFLSALLPRRTKRDRSRDNAIIHHRLDAIEKRLVRIERRLELSW